jgi:hypothetical protein
VEAVRTALDVFLTNAAADWNTDGVKGLTTDPYGGILEWALSMKTGHGNLPGVSGRAFANWLNNQWDNWAEDPEVSVQKVLEGAVTEWCGGRSF